MDMTPPRQKRSRLEDVARQAGVSAQTVSRVLRKPGLVAEATRLRVQGAIDRLGYVPDLVARNLATSTTRMVAAIIPSLASSPFADTMQALSATLAANGYQLLIGDSNYSPEREDELIQAMLGRRPDALVLTGTSRSRKARAMLARAGVPVVETWNLTANPIDLCVGFSNHAAGFDVARYIFRRGYRRVAFIGRLRNDPRSEDRLRGFREGLRGHGMSPVRVIEVGDPATPEVGAAGIDELLRRYPDADAVFFGSDRLAIGGLLACVRRGIAVPERLAIVGFGDFEISSLTVPSLTTIAVPNREVGSVTGELLLARLAGREISERIVDLGYRFIQRESA
jgi:LacI family gluconate utilization system Gnt-I transcriptional repressor